MQGRDDLGALPDGRGHAFDLARADIADGKHAGKIGLERAMTVAEISTGAHKALLVERDARLPEPCRVRLSADKEEEMPDMAPRFLAARTAPPADGFEHAAFAFERSNLRLGKNLDIGKRRDA